MPLPVIVVPAIVSGAVIAAEIGAIANWLTPDVSGQTHLGHTIGTRAWIVALLEQTASAKGWSADELAGMIATADSFLSPIELLFDESDVADVEDLLAIGEAIGSWALAGAAEVGSVITTAGGGVVVSQQAQAVAALPTTIIAGGVSATASDLAAIAGAINEGAKDAYQLPTVAKVGIGVGVGLALLALLRGGR